MPVEYECEAGCGNETCNVSKCCDGCTEAEAREEARHDNALRQDNARYEW